MKGEPFVKLDWLNEYSEGLIALSGGSDGHIGQALLSGNIDLARQRLSYFKKIFRNDFFLEIMRVGKEEEDE